jgi:hypothetical protein
MAHPFRASLIRLSRAFRGSATLPLAGIAVLMLVFSHAGFAADAKEKMPPKFCAFHDDGFDPATDVHAFDRYQDGIAQLLKQERFADLDCVADAARSGKTRFTGGTWKLVEIYSGLEKPRPGHPTEEDWQLHFRLLDKWAVKNPQSVTARIAMAESDTSYAWDARGSGYTDSVSASGWKLFEQRLEKAQAILEKAWSLPTKCPEWYLAMLDVAQGEGWDLSQQTALFGKAAAFDPTFQSYYRNHVIQLLPKWSGEEGDAAVFAGEAADKVGGEAGDILYFQIADKILCACNDPEFGHFSWPRVQKGYAALEKKYGSALLNVNSFALMASKANDLVIADAEFKRMGDNWNKDLWVTEAFFKSERDIAAQMAPMQTLARSFRQEAEANMKTPEGKAYLADFNPKFTAFEQPCLKESNGDTSKFEFFIQVGKNGSADEAHTEKPPNAFTLCIMKALYLSYLGKQTPFPPPPTGPYKMILEIDPTTLNAAK